MSSWELTYFSITKFHYNKLISEVPRISLYWYSTVSVYLLVWAGFSILRVKMHAGLSECHWNSHNQSFFLNAFILSWARNWFCIPFVLSHAPHPQQMSNCGMGRLEIHLQGLPRPKRNPAHSPSCYTARWPTTAVSDLLCMRMKSMKINVCRLNSKWDVT